MQWRGGAQQGAVCNLSRACRRYRRSGSCAWLPGDRRAAPVRMLPLNPSEAPPAAYEPAGSVATPGGGGYPASIAGRRGQVHRYDTIVQRCNRRCPQIRKYACIRRDSNPIMRSWTSQKLQWYIFSGGSVG